MKLTGNEIINSIAFYVEKSNLILGSSDLNMTVNEYVEHCPNMGKRQIMNSDWTYVKTVDNIFDLYQTPIHGGKNSIVLIKN